MQSEGLKIILSGPSGSGKGTIVKELIKEDFVLSISATTRKPRVGEEDAVHYFFKTVEEFEEMNRQGLIVPSIWSRYEKYKQKLLKYIAK